MLRVNAAYQRIGWATPKEAFTAMWGGSHTPPYLAIDFQYELDEKGNPKYDSLLIRQPVTWQEWIQLPIRPWDQSIRSARQLIRIPTVVLCPNFSKMPRKEQRATPSAIKKRDGNKCFVQNTLITMANHSLKPIERVKVGDFILNKYAQKERVAHTKNRLYNGDLVVVKPEGKLSFKMTSNHECIILNKDLLVFKDGKRQPSIGDFRSQDAFKQIKAKDLYIGDILLQPLGLNPKNKFKSIDQKFNKRFFIRIDGIQYLCTKIRDIKYVSVKQTPVYNFETSKTHTYIAGHILTHNCQYTGVELTNKTFSLDHIIPRSKGGRDNWHNLVAAHKDVNSKKGNKFNHEVGLKLLKKPVAPLSLPLCAIYSEIKHPDHQHF